MSLKTMVDATQNGLKMSFFRRYTEGSLVHRFQKAKVESIWEAPNLRTF
jgi:hypothetical protein